MDSKSDDGPSGSKCSCLGSGSGSAMDPTASTSSDNDPSLASPVKDRKLKNALTSFGFNLRRAKSFSFKAKRSKKQTSPNSPGTSTSTKKSPKWPLQFGCTKRASSDSKASTQQEDCSVLATSMSPCCQCACYRHTDDFSGVVNVRDLGNVATVFVTEVRPTANNAPSGAVDASASPTTSSAMAAVGTSDHPHPLNSSGGDHCSAVDAMNALLFSPTTSGVAPIATAAVNAASAGDGANNNALAIYGNNPAWQPVFLSACMVNNIHEDCDEAARIQRAREIEQGVEPPANYRSATRRVQLLCSSSNAESSQTPPRRLQIVCPSDLPVDSLRALFQDHVTLRSCPLDTVAGCHTQIDFVHCLVPDLLSISNCSFYWGKMDRYEAERLLDGKPEGTFLLRDSAQEEFLFSVSFRKYGRSLHARIEQWNHKFSFDSHDPGVYTSETVCGLIEHYKDPSSCMFFEPMLTWPLHRNFTFSLQHLCRAVITNKLGYDDVHRLQLPKSLKSYLREYHYRQKVRVERFDDDDVQWLDLRNGSP